MKSIGSHPGAIFFRLGIMVIVIALLMSIFLSYVENAEKGLERSAILQTRRIIDSSLAVVFATLAVQGRLDELNAAEGANPFVFLEEYDVLPSSYRGSIDYDLSKVSRPDPGWYYQSHRSRVVYVPRFLEADYYFTLVLDYEDRNRSGRFEAEFDVYRSLQFREIDPA